MLKSIEQLEFEAYVRVAALLGIARVKPAEPVRRLVLTDRTRQRGGKKSRRRRARVWEAA